MGNAYAERYFTTKAPHAVILDDKSGKILFEKAADIPISPASMSKLMTVAVVLDLIEKGELTPQTPFRVSEKAWRTGGSKMFVLVDTEIQVEDLLRGVMTVSGNDAAIVLAENIAGSEEAFAQVMNERAKSWGLKASRFHNPTGADHPDQKMSAKDLARLAHQLWHRHPDYRYLYSLPEFTWSEITQANRNPLLRTFPQADGMKTGFTDDAGYSLVGTASKDGARRFIVVAGLDSENDRRREATRMMGLAFSEFDTRQFFAAGDVVGEAEVFGGQVQNVPLVIDVPVLFTLHRQQLDAARAKIVYPGPISAPIPEGEQVAILELTMPGEPKREYPLYTREKVKSLGV
ncbi:MAG: D-alanyl-D-alanine carboxypeptidase family protein, partial [Pseudomonadota bacterium]